MDNQYVLYVSGLNQRSKIYRNRWAANQAMYDLIEKNDLKVKEVYDDKHVKTYICSCGVTFVIGSKY